MIFRSFCVCALLILLAGFALAELRRKSPLSPDTKIAAKQAGDACNATATFIYN